MINWAVLNKAKVILQHFYKSMLEFLSIIKKLSDLSGRYYPLNVEQQ